MVKLLKKLTWKDFILAAVAFVFIIVQDKGQQDE